MNLTEGKGCVFSAVPYTAHEAAVQRLLERRRLWFEGAMTVGHGYIIQFNLDWHLRARDGR